MGVWAWVAGIGAALAFPIVAVSTYRRAERRRNRKMGVRRNDKIRLTPRDGSGERL